MLDSLSAAWGLTRHPLAGLLPVFKNEKCLRLKAFLLERHISHLFLQRECARVRVSSDCRRHSLHMICTKNRMPCHSHKERQSPDDTSVCQFSVIKMPPSQLVGRHLQLALGIEGWWWGCGAVPEDLEVWLCWWCLCTSLSLQVFGISRSLRACRAEDFFPHGDGK